jgi:hypothetical protein
MYVMRIHLPNNKDAEIWIDAGPKTIGIKREISGLIGTLESNSVNLEPGNSTAVGKAHWDNGVIDGLPGLVGTLITPMAVLSS